jgi:DNA (cytosine-5)-methyltransferase 1
LKNHQISVHSEPVQKRFDNLRQGENVAAMLQRLTPKMRDHLNTRKRSCRKIMPTDPSPTVLTLPDDLVHYNPNRILSVREMARLQSFDDSFEFLGKRTTGGERRRKETPQYTLVGNAVPPLLARAIATEIFKNLQMEN